MLSINDFNSSDLEIKDLLCSSESNPLKVYRGFLTYNRDRYPNCGRTGNTVRILIPDTRQYLSYLDLKKQRL